MNSATKDHMADLDATNSAGESAYHVASREQPAVLQLLQDRETETSTGSSWEFWGMRYLTLYHPLKT